MINEWLKNNKETESTKIITKINMELYVGN